MRALFFLLLLAACDKSASPPSPSAYPVKAASLASSEPTSEAGASHAPRDTSSLAFEVTYSSSSIGGSSIFYVASDGFAEAWVSTDGLSSEENRDKRSSKQISTEKLAALERAISDPDFDTLEPLYIDHGIYDAGGSRLVVTRKANMRVIDAVGGRSYPAALENVFQAIYSLQNETISGGKKLSKSGPKISEAFFREQGLALGTKVPEALYNLDFDAVTWNEEPPTKGNITSPIADSGLRRIRTGLKSCYLEDKLTSKGSLKLSVTVTPNGTVDKVETLSALSPALDDCVIALIKVLYFPMPNQAKSGSITYELHFDPKPKK
jgi:hypothetical protein